MENQKFEALFREAFTGAEVAPSKSVWINIELDLEKTSGGKMKGRILFFQLLAAASMVFAMGIGSVYYLNGPQVDDTQFVSKQNNVMLGEKVGVNQNMISSEKANESIAEANNENHNYQVSSSRQSSKNSIVAIEPAAVENQDLVAETFNNEYTTWSNKRQLPRLVEVQQPKLILPAVSEPDPGMVLLARMKDEERKFQIGKKKAKESLWTSIGVGVGSYNPNTSSAALSSVNSFGNPVSSSNPTSGSSYSAGVSVASKVGSRVVLQGGITYLSQNAEFTSSTTADGGFASLNEFIATNEVKTDAVQYAATNPYKVNSNLQYVSIPVQAGYILIDRDFAVQLNGGISTDLFLQNTLTPENENLERITEGAGSESPYRTVNFSGLLGTELSYKVGDHYRVAVNPELRYALNSIYKSDVATDISPVTFDVALRFRYIFN